MPSRSLFLEYGGDFVRNARGGLQVAVDTPTDPRSSLQRMERLVFTNPMVVNGGVVIARGDSLQYRSFGAGVNQLVDRLATQDRLSKFKASLLDQIAQDPGIQQTPAPTVTFTQTGPSTFDLQITFTPNGGKTISTPAYQISVQSSGAI